MFQRLGQSLGPETKIAKAQQHLLDKMIILENNKEEIEK